MIAVGGYLDVVVVEAIIGVAIVAVVAVVLGCLAVVVVVFGCGDVFPRCVGFVECVSIACVCRCVSTVAACVAGDVDFLIDRTDGVTLVVFCVR